jgi:hypothetical protein
MNTMTTRIEKPWYREPWPWILMAGPFIVVVAATFTAWLAVSTSDGLVSEDYYKKGLAVSETLTESAKARSLGVRAGVSLVEGSVRVRLSGRAEVGFSAPSSILITLSHPTRAGVDQMEKLVRQGDAYVGKLNLPSSGHWLVLLEDDAKSWRLMASVVLPSSGETVIGGEAPADIRN